MLSLRLVVVIASLLGFTASQGPTPSPTPSSTAAATPAPWSGCVDPNNPNNPDIIQIGKPTTICLTLGPGGNWAAGVRYGRYTWRPIADQYSKFHIPKCKSIREIVVLNRVIQTSFAKTFLATLPAYEQLVVSQTTGDSVLNGNITVFAASQQMLSFLRVYYDPKEFRIYPFLTAIIDVKQGVVQGIAWDNACVFCSPGRCLENMYNFDGQMASELDVNAPSKGCYFNEEECNEILKTGGTDCDITLFAVWTGTDKKRKTFQSSSKRFSAFPPAGIQDALMNSLPSFSDLNPFR